MRQAQGEFGQTRYAMGSLLREIRSCTICTPHLPLGANPVLRTSPAARVLVVGQAPGTRVHATRIPWNDQSGDKLRQWLSVNREQFYDERFFAIMPMGFCYPGRGKGGDNPPRPECAPLWHAKLTALMPQLKLVLAIGAYAIARYFMPRAGIPLANCIRSADFKQDHVLPLVHPSPRNRLWLKRNPWFETDCVPLLRRRIHALLFDA